MQLSEEPGILSDIYEVMYIVAESKHKHRFFWLEYYASEDTRVYKDEL